MKRPPSLPRLLPGSPPATTLPPTASHVPSPHPPDHPSAPKEEFLSWKYRNGGQREPMRHETKKYSASDWRGECGEGQDGSKAFEKRAHGYRRRRGEASEPRSSPTRYSCALKAPVWGAGVMSGSHLWFWLRRGPCGPRRSPEGTAFVPPLSSAGAPLCTQGSQRGCWSHSRQVPAQWRVQERELRLQTFAKIVAMVTGHRLHRHCCRHWTWAGIWASRFLYGG